MVSCGCKDSFLLGWIWRNSGMCVTLKDNVIQESHDTHTPKTCTQDTAVNYLDSFHCKFRHSARQGRRTTLYTEIQRMNVLAGARNEAQQGVCDDKWKDEISWRIDFLFNGLIQKTWIFGSYTIQTTPSLPLRKYLHYLNCWSQSWFFNC